MNIGILLGAGNSLRFNSKTPKILYKINNKPIIRYSVDLLSEYLDKIVVVVNSKNYKQVKKLLNKKISVIVNNVDTRLDSIKTGLDYISQREDISNVLIHDAARPFISSEMIKTLLDNTEKYQYSQYYLSLVDGLVVKTTTGYDVVDRNKYLQLCTPQIVDYHLFNFLFRKYVYSKNRLSCELLPILNKFNIDFNLIEGQHKYLRKITTIEDTV
jgi:2-C-methyl-D-erythritol 4-phosphate cytidylyltransferase